MAAGADLLSGLETAGPYMFLLAGAAGIAVGAGMLRLHNRARRVAALLALIEIVPFVPRMWRRSCPTHHHSGLEWAGDHRSCGDRLQSFNPYQTRVRELFQTK
jgi:hypothetical protein